MRTIRRTTALVLGAASIALLQVEPGHSQDVDADVPVVENPRAAEAPLLWTVEAEPVVEIGGSETDPDQQLFQVVEAARLDDGRIVVANAGDHQLRFYDAEGSHLFAVGGEGEAPGEFRRFSSFQVGAHDSIHVYDQDLQRVTVFDTQGEVGRTVSVPVEARPPSELRRFRDGRWYAIDGERIRRGPSGTLQRDTAHFNSYDPALEGRSPMIELPGMLTANAGQGGQMFRGAPFTPWPLYDEFGSCLYATSGDHFDLRIVSVEGRPVRIVRNEGERRSVSDEDLSGWTDHMIAEQGITNEGQREAARRVAQMLPHPEELPVYNDLIVDRDGYIWLQLYAPPSGISPRWVVLDPSGELLGSVRMPEAIGAFEIGPDWILAEGSDELGREFVRLYRLDRDTDTEASSTTPPAECATEAAT